MNQKADIYLEVARRAEQYGHLDLSVIYYELYAKEQEQMQETVSGTSSPGVRLYTIHEISQAAAAIRYAKNNSDPGFYHSCKIPAIKHLRTATGMGLKESKELIESIMDNI